VFDGSAPQAVAYLLDGGHYSPLPSAPPSDNPADWQLNLHLLAGDAFAAGTWMNIAATAASQGVRWSIDLPNAAPVVTVPTTASTTSGTMYAVEASFNDRVVDGPWSYSISWADGSQPSTGSAAAPGVITASKLYKQAGAFTVSVTLTDRHGAGASAS
jgi:hypothetical protein